MGGSDQNTLCTFVRFLRNTTKIFKTKKNENKSDNFGSILTLIRIVRMQAEDSIVVEGKKNLRTLQMKLKRVKTQEE